MKESALARLGRGLRKAFKILLATLLVALGLFVSLLLLLDVPRARALAVRETNSALVGLFRGRLQIERAGHVGLLGASGIDAHVDDAAGRRVLTVRGLRVRLAVPRLLWQLVSGKQPLEIRLQEVALDDGDVVLIDDGSGSPTLASAFLPRTPAPPSAASATSTSPLVFLDELRAAHVWAHGGLSSLPVIDADLDKLRAGLRLNARALQIDVRALTLHGRSLPGAVDPRGALEGRASVPMVDGLDPSASAHFKGQLFASDSELDAALLAREVELSLSAHASPATLARFGLRPSAPVKVELHAQGELPTLHAMVRVSAAAAHVELSGTSTFGEPLTASLEARAGAIDLSQLLPDGPSSELGFESHASATLARGALRGQYQLDLPAGRLAGNALPATHVHGTFAQPAGGGFELLADGDLSEPGAPTQLDVTLRTGQRSVVELGTHSELGRPARLRALGVELSGVLDTRGELDLGRQTLVLTANASLRDASAPYVSAGRVAVRASAQGKLSAPRLSALLDARDLTVQGRKFEQAELRALGPLSAIVLSGTARSQQDVNLEWGATVAVTPALTIRDASFGVSRAGLTESARVAKLDFSHGLKLDQVVLDGSLGHVEASFDARAGLGRFELDARDVDAARLQRLLKLDLPVRSGKATLQAKYDPADRGHGFLRGDVSDVSIGRLNKIVVHSDVTLERGTLRGSVRGDLGAAGQLTVTTGELRLPRSGVRGWRELVGTLEAQGKLDLSELRELYADAAVPIERAAGQIDFELSAKREAAGALPDVRARVLTRGLYLVGKRHDDRPLKTVDDARGAEPWSVRDMDLDMLSELNGADGKLRMDAQVVDKLGVLATLDASSDLPSELATHPALLMTMPIEAKLSVPPRDLESLPPLVRPASEAGRANVEVTVSGSFSDPVVQLKGSIARFHDLDSGGRAMDVRVAASYARTHGELDAQSFRKQEKLADFHAEWQGELAALSRLALDAPSPVTANARLDLTGFPVGVLPGAHGLGVRGALDGRIELSRYGEDATLRAELRSDSLRVGGARLGRLELAASAGQGALQASARMEERDGKLSSLANGTMVWGNRIAPSSIKATTGKLQATNFRLNVLAPLVQGSVSELDGRLNAELSATLDRGSPSLQGHASFAQGTAQLPQIGQRFEQISFNAQATPTALKISDIVAHGTTGKLTGNATARVAGLELLDADAHVAIRKDDKLPVTVEGQAIGDAWGNVDVAYRPGDAQKSAQLSVSVPRLHIELPQTSTHSVIDLEPNDDVRTGVWRDDGKFVTLPVQPLRKKASGSAGPPLLVELKLGGDVVVEKGNEATAQLDGVLRLTVDGETRANGELSLRGGFLDVSGKQFKLESGTISFEGGDPSNPTVVATARWDSPADYRVYADFTGQVQKGKLTLHSEPPLTQDQILSLVMFGTPDGSFGSSQGGTGTAGTAIGVVGGTATAGLNRALANFTKLDVSTRVDTSTGSPRPELVVQVTPRIAARVSRAVGDPNPGEPPDRTFLTLDFRLQARWALSTLVGDHGQSQVDLIWRKRY